VHYRYRNTVYHITILRLPEEESGSSIMVDGVRQAGSYLTLLDDRKDHSVVVQFHDTHEHSRGIPSLISAE
jgi:hypothetical protein